MEKNAIIAVVLSILVLVVYQYFFVPTPDQPLSQRNTTKELAQQDHAGEKRAGEISQAPGKKSSTIQPASPVQTGVSENNTASQLPEKAAEGQDIVVETSLFRATFTESGGAIKSFVLKKYRQTLDKNSPGVELVNVAPPILPLGLKLTANNKPVDMRGLKFNYEGPAKIILSEPEQEQKIVLSARLQDGTGIKKIFSIKNDTYLIHLEVLVENGSAGNYTLFLYNRPYKHGKSRYIFTGPSYCSQGRMTEVKIDKPGQHQQFTGYVDWMAYGDNYFMTSVIPDIPETQWRLDFNRIDQDGLTESAISRSIAPDKQQKRVAEMEVYFGPKEIKRLNALGHNLSAAINFGWFDPIAKPLLYTLHFLYRYLHNYGLAIIVLTILIKIVFWPLSHKSAKSMKTMQKLAPKLQKIKEKYGDDKERLNKEMMQLYKTYKVNPMSGCLPMLLQIPVFFALYKVLLMSIELRHAPFMLWINDLSAPDRLMVPGIEIPYLGGLPVLTVLMGASMWLQMKMSPSSMDPTQAKIMQMLPIVFTFMFISFPSGLVLYWLVNNILTIAQQYYINKFTE